MLSQSSLPATCWSSENAQTSEWFFFSSRRRHTRLQGDWSSDVCSSDLRVASILAGSEVAASDQVVRETVCELANMVIGNSVTLLNDQGYRFKVFPPEVHMNDEGLSGSHDTEALVLAIETPCGEIYLNIAMRHLTRRRAERDAAPVAS